jgi:hypothetical protein
VSCFVTDSAAHVRWVVADSAELLSVTMCNGPTNAIVCNKTLI